MSKVEQWIECDLRYVAETKLGRLTDDELAKLYFGIGKKQPERVNIEVLRDMIKENPDSMAVAARRWLGSTGEDKDDEDDSNDGAAS